MSNNKDSFATILSNAIRNGEELLQVLLAEDFETANEMTDEWGQTILSIFVNDWSEAEIQSNKEALKRLLLLQDDLTKQAEFARNKLSNLRREQNEKTRAANAYQSAGNTYSD